MRYIPISKDYVCTQCGKSNQGLIEIEIDEQDMRYCPTCWELVGWKMAERFLSGK